jgi:hypothetical protein
MEDIESVPAPAPMPAPPSHRLRTILFTIVLVAIAFAAGYVPKELEVRKLRTSLSAAELDLRLANLHRMLGVASEEAARNNYANAAAAAQSFLNDCRALTQEGRFTEQPRTQEAISSYIVTMNDLLPRITDGDPAVKEQLTGLYLAMDGVVQRRL